VNKKAISGWPFLLFVFMVLLWWPFFGAAGLIGFIDSDNDPPRIGTFQTALGLTYIFVPPSLAFLNLLAVFCYRRLWVLVFSYTIFLLMLIVPFVGFI